MYVPRTITGLDERRVTQADANEHWLKLTNVQRFSFYTLAKLGYQLLFVRQSDQRSTAFAKQDDQLATIDDAGDIDFSPTLVVRD